MHIEGNWQDKDTAKTWMRDALKISRCAQRLGRNRIRGESENEHRDRSESVQFAVLTESYLNLRPDKRREVVSPRVVARRHAGVPPRASGTIAPPRRWQPDGPGLAMTQCAWAPWPRRILGRLV